MRFGGLIFWALILALGAAPAASRGEVLAVARALAQVGDELLIAADLERNLEPVYRQLEEVYSGAELAEVKDRMRSNAIQGWVERELLRQRARRDDEIRVSNREVEARLAEIRSAYPSLAEYEEDLVREGMTEDDLRDQIRDEIKIQRLVTLEVRQRVNVPPGEIISYYERNRDEFSESELVRFSHILIRAGADEEERADGRERAGTILARIEEGEDFEELARAYSQGPRAEQGGDWGFVERGEILPVLEEEVFSLRVGRHSRLIESDLGFHIVWVTGRRDAGIRPLEEVWTEIETELFSRRFEEKFRDWVERLKAETYVAIFE